jgi:hypothetical protein
MFRDRIPCESIFNELEGYAPREYATRTDSRWVVQLRSGPTLRVAQGNLLPNIRWREIAAQIAGRGKG